MHRPPTPLPTTHTLNGGARMEQEAALMPELKHLKTEDTTIARGLDRTWRNIATRTA